MHFERITGILIEQAKDFWLLHPMKEVREATSEDRKKISTAGVPESRLKAMVGGFYLTYTMFKTIPETIRKIKIQMDVQDLHCLKHFQFCVEKSKVSKFVKKIIEAMMYDLSLDGAFRLCASRVVRAIHISACLFLGNQDEWDVNQLINYFCL